MKQRSNFLFLMAFGAVALGSVPAFASDSHSTPGLDAPTLTGLATAGYMGFQYFKTCNPFGRKEK